MGESAQQSDNNKTVKRKMHLPGKVIKITLAGAVIDMGLDKPGVVHISRMQKGPIKRVDDVVSIGDTIDTWVHQVNKNSAFIELTMLKPAAVDWGELKVGMTVEGVVVKLEKFGAFIDIGTERPGLAHISELKNDYIKEVSDAVTVGDEVKAQVLNVDRKKKQIKLSLKALQEIEARVEIDSLDEDEELQEEIPTAMEIALRRAMDGEEDEDEDAIVVDAPIEIVVEESSSKEMDEREEILARTLANKVRTQ